MKKIIIISIGIIISAYACKQDLQKTKRKEIASLEKELFQSNVLDREKGLNMIDTYMDYAKEFPKDTMSAVFLFKAGEIAMNLKLGTQSVLYFDMATSIFPDFHKTPECLFLKAFVYDNEIKNLDEAKKYYEEFIKKYPNHILVKDAKASVKYLGKTPEELIKIFQEQNKN